MRATSAAPSSGTRGELKASVGAGGVRVRLLDPAQRDDAERVLSATLGVSVHPDRDPATLAASLQADGDDAARRVAHALTELSGSGIGVSDFALGQPSLDEVFLALTGRRVESELSGKEVIA
jgi:ABC-2 type transport system ATP-binding protein